MFATIVITMPTSIPDEGERIATLLSRGDVDIVHIRKPGYNINDTERLILSVPVDYHPRLVIHDHFSLAEKYHLYGIHLNSRNPNVPEGWQGSISRSCHSFQELEEWKERCTYVSLSPIFDSISKEGYTSAFCKEEIREAVRNGIIDYKVYALGGVTFKCLKKVEEMGFGGAMILGDAWR